ncbi:MAG: acetyl-CoA carboxylase biotin carboxylase subunit [Pseudomonadota bacterium]|nr:acetyl-CoA carboxylase biotin carboxylase subunit [Pseudomonadota bacterium]
MIRKILIANRGEIACRVMRTAKQMGIKTVAVYSDADADSMHVEMADEAKYIGGARAQDSYLNVDAIAAAIRETGADGVHPGYGFLSENAAFAEACAEAGAAFIGPPPSAIRAMGSKSEAKRLMEEAGVPLLPGYHGDDQSDERLTAAAEEIGFPVMVKAAAGGGGRGMRMIGDAAALADGLAGARREAKAGFGDDTLLIEKYLGKPRHIEMQVFADTHGNAVHVFERDCSIQRRHQKVVEEAPAPGMTAEMRAAMADAAVKAAQAIDYVGAGTVEFLIEAERMGAPDCFYFMEMNTRLQVEHPVSEMIAGVDLVEWQIRVADGEALPMTQDQIQLDGHAVEVRLYAEDPSRDFRPSPGPLDHFRTPLEDTHVRIDTGVREGDEVTMHYDPMIAKVIGWDRDRTSAIARLGQALEQTHVVGTTTNLDFLSAICGSAAFIEANLDTGFIEQNAKTLFPEAGAIDAATLALAALAELIWQGDAAARKGRVSGDPYSPWQMNDGWRVNDCGHVDLPFRDGEEEVTVVAYMDGAGYRMVIREKELTVRGAFDAEGRLAAEIDGHRVTASVIRHGEERHILGPLGTRQLAYVNPHQAQASSGSHGGRLTSPLPGRVVSVVVAAGDSVSAGQTLMVIEAMKMEHSITAPAASTVETVHFSEGDQVDEGAELVALLPE